MRPRLVDVADHQVHLVGDRHVAANQILARPDRLNRRSGPVRRTRRIRIREQLHVSKSGRTEQVRGNLVAGEAAGVYWIRAVVRGLVRIANLSRPMRQRSGKKLLWSTEVSELLLRRRHVGGKDDAAIFTAPLFRPEEEHSVLDDWAAEVSTVVVVIEFWSLIARTVDEEVVAVEGVVPVELEQAAVKVVAATLGDQVDDRALRLTKLRAEAIALNTKLLNRVD